MLINIVTRQFQLVVQSIDPFPSTTAHQQTLLCSCASFTILSKLNRYSIHAYTSPPDVRTNQAPVNLCFVFSSFASLPRKHTKSTYNAAKPTRPSDSNRAGICNQFLIFLPFTARRDNRHGKQTLRTIITRNN